MDNEISKITEDFVIVKYHKDIITYVDSLQKKNAESLSFYPKCVFEREVEKGRIFLGLLNGSPCGYLYVGAGASDVRCHQVCIQYDARNKLYGSALVQAMEDYANIKGAYTITLRCAFDLEANLFWKEMGYGCVGVVDGGVRRMRRINIWRKQLVAELFLDRIMEPESGKTDSSIWRKNKVTGLVTKHNRGKSIKEYRAIVIGRDD